MRKFIYKSVVGLAIVIMIHVLLAFLANGTTDNYYSKFSSPKQNSIIIGTSRAYQGIIPTIVDSIITDLEYSKAYNFAFTISSSPYGKVYYDAINKKINKSTENGYFILAIDPWSISQAEDVSDNQIDNKSILYGLNDFSSYPNFEYLYQRYSHGWGMIAFKRCETSVLKKLSEGLNKSISGSFSEVEKDGWLNVYTSMDSSFVKNKEHKTFKKYEALASSNSFSEYRYKYLLKTIHLLKKYGDVYLVRLPIHKNMLQIETKYMSDFNKRLDEAIKLSNAYLDMNSENPQNYIFTDGDHLHKESAHVVSLRLANWIKNYKHTKDSTTSLSNKETL